MGGSGNEWEGVSALWREGAGRRERERGGSVKIVYFSNDIFHYTVFYKNMFSLQITL